MNPDVRELADEHATAVLASDVAAAIAPGDAVLLHGGLGVGKTAFARALLRILAQDPALEVPSPTFTLVQAYDEGRFPAAHFDLYRLSAPEELDELGYADALAEGVVLVEWPERAGDLGPQDGFDITLDLAGPSARVARVVATGAAAERWKRSLEVRAFLAANGLAGALRRHVTGDVSVRHYERAGDWNGETLIVMDHPPQPPAEPGSDDALVHRSRTVGPFVTIAEALRAEGLSTPAIHAADEGRGFVLMEDLGAVTVLDADRAPIPERYEAAIDLLAMLHARPRPRTMEIGGRSRALPPYDRRIMRYELGRFLSYFVEEGRPADAAAAMIARFDAIWAPLLALAEAAPATWLLRDFHSPNLLWLERRQGIRRLGVLDFQDALYGPEAYDVASLTWDARATVPEALQADLLARYIAARGPGFDADSFRTLHAILGVHRILRVVALFARLESEGRTGYATHLPRSRAYLDQCLAHPVLSDLAEWYEGVRARAEVIRKHER